MKAISLWEPWATLIAIEKKRYETRSWATSYRGPLLICASKKQLPLPEIIGLLYAAGISKTDLNYGRAVCIVDLIDIFHTEDLNVGKEEKCFGDFTPGRFAWQFENIRRFQNPLYIRGKQGLFNVSDFYLGLKFAQSLHSLPASP